MQETHARYEFRAFAQNFGLVEEKIRQFSVFEKFRENAEVYILAALNSDRNVKIRYDTLDIKVLVKEERGLQQWHPQMKTGFPLRVETIQDEAKKRQIEKDLVERGIVPNATHYDESPRLAWCSNFLAAAILAAVLVLIYFWPDLAPVIILMGLIPLVLLWFVRRSMD